MPIRFCRAVLVLAFAVAIAPACPALLRGQDLVISEFLAINTSNLSDEDGETSDWLEIHNQGFEPVALEGWHLTDDPDEPARWPLPAIELAGGGRLLVFASGKDRRDPGRELHTNFGLRGTGEYLALTRPDGSVAHAYEPRYPEQYANLSYGVGRDLLIDALSPARSSCRVLVPPDDSLGLTWTGGAEPFDDSSWTTGETGVGYLVSRPGFAVRTLIASVGVASLAIAEDVAGNSNLQAGVFDANAPWIDYFNSGGTGHHGNNVPFPGLPVGVDADDFVVEVRANVVIPQAGAWTFGVNSDDGFGLDLAGHGAAFRIEHPAPRGPGDTLGVFDVPVAGTYALRLLFYERGGGAELELFARRGSFSAWSSEFRLVGDTASGGLEAFSDVGEFGGFSRFRDAIRTDVEASMRGLRTGAYVRIPFEVADPATHDSLALRVQYDDGFVAYLNGVEIARRNAPATIAYDSRATTDRRPDDATNFEQLDISDRIDLLRAGSNVLALQGLNDAADSGDFLIRAELAEITVISMAQGYYAVPTPGAENAEAFLDLVADTKFNPDRGFHDAPFEVSITTATPDAVIRYTTDGSAPTESSGEIYTGPIPVTRTTTLRAAAFRPGFVPSDVDTHTYLFLDDVPTQVGAGFPTSWGPREADYEVDPDVVSHPAYRDGFRDDLLSLPALSIVMSRDDLFGASRGIYANSGGSGIAWERPGSIELIVPDGVEIPGGGGGFHANCGVRMHGGVGRNPIVPKHSFRFLFKGAYGPTKLRYPLFEGTPQLVGSRATDEFDTLILRAGFNNSWVWNSPGENRQAQYLRDQFIRDSLLAMGTPAPHGRFVHVWVNGLYWGVYNLVERPNAPFCSAYFGGVKDDWDVLNSGEAVDGDRNAWDALYSIVRGGLSDEARLALVREYLDVDNLIDYMLANFYGANGDWDGHNWYSGRHRQPGAGYKFFSWDAERTLEGVSSSRVEINSDGNPSGIYGALRANEEFRVRFGDRAHRHLFNAGALTSQATFERYGRRADEIYRAIVGESARWGDTWRDSPYTRDVEWVAERDRLLQTYFPRRSEILVDQLRNASLYPNVAAPRFSQHGGGFAPGFRLLVSTAEGTVYYTLDGSDPRLPGGAVNPGAEIAGSVATATLFATDSRVRARVPVDGSLGLDWVSTDFDDSTWIEGGNGVGYENGSGYEQLIATDVGAQMSGVNPSVYIRCGFDVVDPAALAFLELRMQFEDGFVAFLNGQRVAQRNSPATLEWNSSAIASNPDTSAVVFETIELPTDVLDLLRPGRNVLAIQGLNSSAGSSDLLILPELRSARTTGQGVQLFASTTVRARTLLDGSWSALTGAEFISDAAFPLRITEIMYHPPGLGAGQPFGADEFEFIELMNVGAETIVLEQVRFLIGVSFDFSDASVESLAPGQRVVIVSNLEAFRSLYGDAVGEVAGVYEGRLSNSGERIALVDASGDTIHDFEFDDDWYPETDGGGYSLVIVDPLAPSATWGERASWQPSAEIDGSPGSGESEITPAGRQVPGDSNQDGRLDISDAVSFLRRLFLAAGDPLPCEGATLSEGGNAAIFDLNGDTGVDVSDAIHLLGYLFQAGPSPARGAGCVRVPGCPTVCVP